MQIPVLGSRAPAPRSRAQRAPRRRRRALRRHARQRDARDAADRQGRARGLRDRPGLGRRAHRDPRRQALRRARARASRSATTWSRRAARAAAHAGVAARAHFRNQDLFKTDLSPANVVTLYLLPDVNLQLRPKLLQLRPGHARRLARLRHGRLGTRQDGRRGRARQADRASRRRARCTLWIVPARVEGLWCGSRQGEGHAASTIAQSYQNVRVDVPEADGMRGFEGKVEANIMRSQAGANDHRRERKPARDIRRGTIGATQGRNLRAAQGPNCG